MGFPFEPFITPLLAGAGGMVGIGLIISTAYHNYKMREYARRQAEALEKLREEKIWE